jgi:hypothetical protein
MSSAVSHKPAMLRTALTAKPAVAASFQWPWDIAKRGAEYFSQVGGVAQSLTSAGQAITSSPNGASAISSIASGPTDSANTNQVLNNGLFTSALDSVKADQLLRTVFIGWAGGAQVGLFGGGGGSGVAYDIIDHSNQAAVTYGMFKLGIGAQISTGLLLGAMSSAPPALNDSTAAWEFGASLMGIGAFVSVIMSDSNLDLIGFTVNIGVGGGYSSATGYGSISAAATGRQVGA